MYHLLRRLAKKKEERILFILLGIITTKKWKNLCCISSHLVGSKISLIVITREPSMIHVDIFQTMVNHYHLHFVFTVVVYKKKRHNSRFGLYCGLRVAESIKLLGLKKMHSDKLRELVKQAYNEILRVTVVQEVGILDTHNQYEIPLCLENRTMKNVVRHFAYQKFSAAMENRLKNGSVESEGNGTFSFFKALNIEDEI